MKGELKSTTKKNHFSQSRNLLILFIYLFIYLFITILFISRENVREGEREGQKHQCVVASHAPPTGDLTCNLDMCPKWESNQRTFGLQARVQSTEQHQPVLILF